MNRYWGERDCMYNEEMCRSSTFRSIQMYSQERMSKEPWNRNRSSFNTDLMNCLTDRSRQFSSPYNYYDNIYPSWNANERRRRSQSAPREYSSRELAKFRQERAWRNKDESFRYSFPTVSKNECSKGNAILANALPYTNNIHKFRAIFRSESVVTPNNSRILRGQMKEETALHLNNIVQNIELPTFSDEKDSDVSEKKVGCDITSYFGESITRLNESSSTLSINLPIVDWPKNAYSFGSIPVFDSETCVGGDGLTLEVFYLCKYCKMFAGGAEVRNHLRSRYHYDRYREYLKTGVPLSSSSDSSSSEEDEVIKQEPMASSTRAEINNTDLSDLKNSPDSITEMDLNYSDDINLYYHEELDYE